MEKQSLGVRKGAWTKEEDNLLTKCIHKFGEGRWHLVPLRAGLNRCRKSCRLRWLNYLNPNVKRGIFNQDEVDLIVRMHKLLGNKWSLIAGRIPGRTANDVKNFWNTHISKRSPAAVVVRESHAGPNKPAVTKCNIVRPQPRNVSRKLQPFPLELTTTSKTTSRLAGDKNNNRPSTSTENEITTNRQPLDGDQLVPDKVEECMRWWAKLLDASENDNGSRSVPFSFPDDDAHQLMRLSPGPGNQANDHNSIKDDGALDLDVDAIWDLVSMENQ